MKKNGKDAKDVKEKLWNGLKEEYNQIENYKEKIARLTTGAKGCYFLAAFLLVSNMYITNI